MLRITGFILFTLFLFRGEAGSQPTCAASSTDFIPINDLKREIFINAWGESWQGGLYPGGSNFLPDSHKKTGLELAARVKPLNSAGISDETSGKIVWLSIGMSNTTQETQQFISLANASQGKNPKLVLVDGAQGGMTAAIISTERQSNYSTFWATVSQRLTNAGVSANQVQAVWLKEADVAGNTAIKIYYDSLVVRYKRILNELKQRFPNVKLCYLSGRISARYAASTLNPEPYAYYSGWVVKKVIEDQINGDSQLQYSGVGARSPWIAWGSYFWSDGSTPQASDPTIFWTCPTDFQSDGTHPSSPTGARKAGNILLNFFATDSTTTPWFTKTGATSSIGELKNDVILYPNPFNDRIKIASITVSENTVLSLYNHLGQLIKECSLRAGTAVSCQLEELPSGIYFVRMTSENRLIYTGKLIAR